MESGQSMVSVVIPVHNRAGTIRYCLDSVLGQTFDNFEVIVVDDASTDDTAAQVRSIQDARLRLLPNNGPRGAQAARNTGILAARSPWIAFQDSDDEWVPDKLERQLAALADAGYEPLTVVHSNCWRYYPQADTREVWGLDTVAGDRPFTATLAGPGPMFQGMLTSRLALERIGMLDEQVPSYQEWDTAIRLARECRFIHLEEPLFIYYLHEGPAISADSGRDFAGYEYVVEKHREDIRRECGEAGLQAHYHLLLRKCLNGRRWQDADRFFSKLGRGDATLLALRLLRLLRLAPVDVRRWLRLPRRPKAEQAA